MIKEIKTKFEIDNLLLEKRLEKEKEEKNAWHFPTDRFMGELTEQIFKNTIIEAGLARRGNESIKVYRDKLNEIVEFANNEKDYWWQCMEEFCPDDDRKKIKRKIIKTATATLEKL